jgi:hypothetical protein
MEQKGSRSILRASPGDRLIVRGHHQGEPERDGEIKEVLGEDGAPPYLVEWDDGHVSELFPGDDAHIQHFDDRAKSGRRKAARKPKG